MLGENYIQKPIFQVSFLKFEPYAIIFSKVLQRDNTCKDATAAQSPDVSVLLISIRIESRNQFYFTRYGDRGCFVAIKRNRYSATMLLIDFPCKHGLLSDLKSILEKHSETFEISQNVAEGTSFELQGSWGV